MEKEDCVGAVKTVCLSKEESGVATRPAVGGREQEMREDLMGYIGELLVVLAAFIGAGGVLLWVAAVAEEVVWQLAIVVVLLGTCAWMLKKLGGVLTGLIGMVKALLEERGARW